MGAKNLKAIVARGGACKYVAYDADAFKKYRRRALKKINRNRYTAELYRNLGTNANVRFCNDGGILPVRNFRYGSHEHAQKIFGETLRDKYQAKTSSCKACAILCGHKGTMNGANGHPIPEYESTALLGPNLGIFDSDRIVDWNGLCSKLGLDTITTGVTLSYLMEAGENGLIPTTLKFGSPDGISETIEDIAHRRGQGDELANGSRWLSQKYGGVEFAMHVKGLEMAAYDPRGSWGQGLAYAVANRGGCHLSATIFALEVFMKYLNPTTTRAKAKFVRFFESLYSAVNSLQTCLFTGYAYILEDPIVKYSPAPLLKLSMQNFPGLSTKVINIREFIKLFEAVTGIKLSRGEFLRVGDRIQTLERYMNTLEGISRADDTLPGRFLNQNGSANGRNHAVPLERMITQYYKIRGYDNNGIPTATTLKKYGIARNGK